jgi:ABC-type multidrug transport system ATPase subunit
VLLRELADAGAAVLLYTSELKEIPLVCDRAIVIFGGRVVDEIDAATADEPTLLRAAYHLRSDAAMPEEVAAEAAEAAASEAAVAEPETAVTQPEAAVTQPETAVVGSEEADASPAPTEDEA